LDIKSVKYYEQNAAHLAPEYHSAGVTGIHTLLGLWLPTGGEVLEIGCGAGRDARLFVNREPAQVQLFFERIGSRLLFAEENQD
jgi:cyclopropane fatty-acyl-phospholipid synthase-like methyltransferase